jgi:hypothetical protein
MPRPISRDLLRVLDSDDFFPIDLLDIQLVGQNSADILHFTSAGNTVTWRSTSYLPLGFAVTRIDEKVASSSGEVPSVGLALTDVDGQIASLLAVNELDGAEATLWRTDRRLLTDRAPTQITIGEIRNVEMSDDAVAFQIVSILGQLDRITIPRRSYGSHCSLIFGSVACGANPKTGNDAGGIPISISTTVQSGSTKNYLVLPSGVLTTAGSPANPSDFFDQATIIMTDGTAGLQQRPFQRYELVGSENRFWFRHPLLSLPTAGDPLILRRRCRFTVLDCKKYLGNALQFQGFRDVPPVSFKPDETDHI